MKLKSPKINLQEMKDWKQHFVNGTKGMPKTNPMILNYVESILKKAYDGNEERVNNNPIAPWLVGVINTIGPANINTEKLNRIKAVITYVQKTGNVANIPKMDLNQGSDFAKEKLDKMAEKEKLNAQDKNSQTAENPQPEEKKKKELSPAELALKYQKSSKQLFPELADETAGKIERVWTCTDGSGRIWVKVIDNNWLSKSCQTGQKWGIICQDTSFGNSSYVNYQLIGPPKGKSTPLITIIGMGVLKSKKSVAEVKQEGNVQPGSQRTSGGWDDADEQLIEFLSYAPEAKWIEYFGDYSGEIILNAQKSLYGGGIGFLYHLAQERPDLFKKLTTTRPDMIQNNEMIIKQLFPNVDELLNFDIKEFAKTKPDLFLLKLKDYLKKYGEDAKEALSSIDLEEYVVSSPNLIQTLLPELTGVINDNLLSKIIDKLDLSNYVYNDRLNAYALFKKLSILNNKNLLKNIIQKYAQPIMNGAGGGTKGAIEFLRQMEKPKLDNHAGAKKDLTDGKYYAEREENVKDEKGQDVRDQFGNIQTKIVKFEIPDNLLILSQKERRDFINANKDYIRDSFKGIDEKGKEINYLRLLFSQSNPQEVDKTMKKERDEFINYYNAKFKLGEKKKVKIEKTGEEIESTYMPGEFELFSILNPKGVVSEGGKVYYPIGVEETKKNKVDIINYYYNQNISKEKDDIKKYLGKRITPELAKQEFLKRMPKLKYAAIKDFLLTLIYSGESEEKALELFFESFSPERIEGITKVTFYSIFRLINGYTLMLSSIKDVVSDELFFKTLNDLKPKLLELGEQGKLVYQNYITLLDISVFEVKVGDFVEYNNDDSLEYYTTRWQGNLDKPVISNGPIFLTDGRKYNVLETGTFAGSVNGKLLILDEGYTSVHGEQVKPQKRWFSSKLFKISKKTERKQIYEDAFRKFVRKRIPMVAESRSVSYTGILLDNKSKTKLIEWIKEMIKIKKLPSFEGWEMSSDHVTINPGSAKDPSLIGKQIDIKVIQYAFNDKTAAIAVVPLIEEYEIQFGDKIKRPHITLAYDSANGARPVQSNELSDWKPVPKSFILSGIIKEVPSIF